MGVNCSLMFHDGGFLCAMENPHDIDVAELGTSFTPVAVGEDVVAADLAPGALFHTDGDLPVKKTVEAGDAFSGVGGFHVFEEGGESADDLLVH